VNLKKSPGFVYLFFFCMSFHTSVVLKIQKLLLFRAMHNYITLSMSESNNSENFNAAEKMLKTLTQNFIPMKMKELLPRTCR
jgi:hypothetical protein